MLDRIKQEELPALSSVATFLDDVWAPNFVFDALRGGAQDQQSQVLRAQKRAFHHALLYSERVIVNRSFLANSAYMQSLWSSEGEREQLFKLIAPGAGKQPAAIVPYLLRELHPGDYKPTSESVRAPWAKFWDACETRGQPTVLRLGWPDSDDKVNDDANAEMALDFRQFFAEAPQKLKLTDLAGRFGLDKENADFLRDRLQHAAALTQESDFNRSILYNTLLGGIPKHADNDFAHYTPGHVALKALIDNRYSFNLSDYIDRFAILGQDTPSRAILQEYEELGAGAPACDPEALALICQNFLHQLALQEIGHVDPADLDLADIVALREGQLWKDYIAAATDVLQVDDVPLAQHPARVRENALRLRQLFNEFWRIGGGARQRLKAADTRHHTVSLLIEIVGATSKGFAINVTSEDTKIVLENIGDAMELAAPFAGHALMLISAVFGSSGRTARAKEVKIPLARIKSESLEQDFRAFVRCLGARASAAPYSGDFDAALIGPEHKDADA